MALEQEEEQMIENLANLLAPEQDKSLLLFFSLKAKP